MFTYGSKDQNVWACIHGTLSVEPGPRASSTSYWNPVVAAWYPEGKDDPHLTLLRFDADDGRIWVSTRAAPASPTSRQGQPDQDHAGRRRRRGRQPATRLSDRHERHKAGCRVIAAAFSA